MLAPVGTGLLALALALGAWLLLGAEREGPVVHADAPRAARSTAQAGPEDLAEVPHVPERTTPQDATDADCGARRAAVGEPVRDVVRLEPACPLGTCRAVLGEADGGTRTVALERTLDEVRAELRASLEGEDEP